MDSHRSCPTSSVSHVAFSFNGRTLGSGPGYVGSNPTEAAKQFHGVCSSAVERWSVAPVVEGSNPSRLPKFSSTRSNKSESRG